MGVEEKGSGVTANFTWWSWKHVISSSVDTDLFCLPQLPDTIPYPNSRTRARLSLYTLAFELPQPLR
jgi:hypothetical protein